MSTAAAALAAIAGAEQARALVQYLRSGAALPEALLDALARIRATGDTSMLRGFARELEKTLEARR